MNRKELIIRLEKQIEKIEGLKKTQEFHPKHQIWADTTKNLIRELFNEKYLKMFQAAGEIMVYGDDEQVYRQFVEGLEDQKQLLEGFIEEYEDLKESPISVSKKFRLEDYELHPRIQEVSGDLFTDGHYKQAILDAYIEVIDTVKSVANHPVDKNDRVLDGDSLMNTVFGCDTREPLIKLNKLENIADKDEQRGFMYLFKGICGLRNKKGHKNFVQNNPNRTIEHLSLASLLMGLLDDEFIAEYNI